MPDCCGGIAFLASSYWLHLHVYMLSMGRLLSAAARLRSVVFAASSSPDTELD